MGLKKVHCFTRDFSPCLCHGTFQRQNSSFVSSAFSLHMAWIVIRFLSGNKVHRFFGARYMRHRDRRHSAAAFCLCHPMENGKGRLLRKCRCS
ncbi:hypothetical protein C0J52_28265 [Blattella germanica]|nr:hypothetical protein C0J52_28265 [Blattella germanica]